MPHGRDTDENPPADPPRGEPGRRPEHLGHDALKEALSRVENFGSPDADFPGLARDPLPAFRPPTQPEAAIDAVADAARTMAEHWPIKDGRCSCPNCSSPAGVVVELGARLDCPNCSAMLPIHVKLSARDTDPDARPAVDTPAVFEVVDATDVESYSTLGTFPTLDQARAAANADQPTTEPYGWIAWEDKAVIEIRQRCYGFQDDAAPIVETITWEYLEADPDDDENDDYEWRQVPNVCEP